MNSFGAPFPTKSHTCSKAVETHENMMRRPMQMAPKGSNHQTSLVPTMDMIKPNTFTTISLRWSIYRSVRLWLVSRIYKEDSQRRPCTQDSAWGTSSRPSYKTWKRLKVVSGTRNIRMMPWPRTGYADTDKGHDIKWIAMFSTSAQCTAGFNLSGINIRTALSHSLVQRTSNCTATVVIRAQKRMIPIVSIRVRPYLFVSYIFLSKPVSFLPQDICTHSVFLPDMKLSA